MYDMNGITWLLYCTQPSLFHVSHTKLHFGRGKNVSHHEDLDRVGRQPHADDDVQCPLEPTEAGLEHVSWTTLWSVEIWNSAARLNVDWSSSLWKKIEKINETNEGGKCWPAPARWHLRGTGTKQTRHCPRNPRHLRRVRYLHVRIESDQDDPGVIQYSGILFLIFSGVFTTYT